MRAEAAIILCAGASRRMGRPKGLLLLDGKPLLRRQVEAFARFSEQVIVVLGSRAREHLHALPAAVRVVYNRDWAAGFPADSLHLAVRTLGVRGSCWVTPVDVSPPTEDTLGALLAAGPPAVPVDSAARDGHPVLLGPEELEQLRRQAPDGGLRTLLGGARRVPVADPMVARDFDDPAAWEAFLASRPHGTD